MDFRSSKSEEHLSLRSASFRTKVANLAAPLHGKNKDELDGDDLREHRKTIRVAGLAVAGLVILLCAALVAAWVANEQRKLKDRQRQVAVARLLTAESASTLGPDMESRERSGILALEALRRFDRQGIRSLEADQAVRSALAILGQRRFGFDAGTSTNDVAFGRDDETVVAASVYGGPMRWHLRTRQSLPAGRRNQRFRHVVLSADGRYVATAEYQPPGLEVRVEPVEGPGSSTPPTHLGQLPIAVSPAGRYLLVGSIDRSGTELIDLNRGETVERLPAAAQVAFSPDGRYVAAATIGSTEVWRLGSSESASRLSPVSLHRSPPGAFAFSADSNYLAIRERDEDQVLVLNLSTGTEVTRLPAMGDPGKSMALSAGARYLAMARLYDVIVQHVPTGASLLLPYGREIAKLSFGPRTFLLAAAGLQNEVMGWEILRLAEKSMIAPPGPIEALHISESAGALTLLTRDQPAGPGLLASRVYRLDDGAPARAEMTHGSVRAALSGTAGFLAAPGDSGIRIWNVNTGHEETGAGDSVPISVLAISDDGRYVAVHERDGAVRVLDRTSGATIPPFATQAEDISVTLGVNGWYMIGTTSRALGQGTRGSRVESTMQVWDLRARRPIAGLVFTGRRLPALFIDPTGSVVAQDSPVVEDLATGARQTSSGVLRPIVLDSPDAAFRYVGSFVTFSPNGRYFVTRADNDELRVWDASSRREISRLSGGTSARIAALSDTARYLAVLQDDAIRVWPLMSLDLRLQGCQMITIKKLDAIMWQRFWDTDVHEDTCGSD